MLSNHLILCHPLLLLPSIFSSIRVLPMSLFFASDGQSIRASKNQSFQWIFKGWFPLGLTALIFLLSKRLTRAFSISTVQSISSLALSLFFMVQLSHPCMTVGKTIALTIWTFVNKVMSLLFKSLSRFVIAFLPRCRSLFILWQHSPSTVILEPKKIKSSTASTFSPSICREVMGPDAKYWSG